MEPEKKSNGTLVGIIIILVILLIGGIYTYQSKMKSSLEEKAAKQDTITNDANELNALQQDLNTTDTNLNVDVKTLQ